MINIFNYIDRPSPIHRLTGATKLVCLLLWSLASMITYDTRILAAMPIISIGLFAISKIHIKDVKFMLWVTVVFMVLNNVMVFVFSPSTAWRSTAPRRSCSPSQGPTWSPPSSFSTT